MSKLKMANVKLFGKECKVYNLEDTIPSLVDEGEIRGGEGNPVKLDKVRGKATTELEEYMSENNILDFLNHRQN